MPESSPDAKRGAAPSPGFLAELSKQTLSELRVHHGDMAATREALIRFFGRGLSGGLSLQACIALLFFEPCQAGSLIRRVGYTELEYDFLVRMVQELSVLEIFGAGINAEPGVSPNVGPAGPQGGSEAAGGPPSVN